MKHESEQAQIFYDQTLIDTKMITSIYVSIDEGATIKEIRNLSPEEFKQLVLIIQQLMDEK